MAYFANVENNKVIEVIIAEQEYIDTLPGTWIETDPDTSGGIHYGPDGQPDGGVALRGNYAGIGYNYDSVLDIFYPDSQEPTGAMTLDPVSALWVVVPQYQPLMAVSAASIPTLIPDGTAGQPIDIDGRTIYENQLVLFQNAGNKTVYRYDQVTGKFVEVVSVLEVTPKESTVYVTPDYDTYYLWDGTAWISYQF